MPDTSKLEKLNRELEKSEKKLRKAINDEKALQHQRLTVMGLRDRTAAMAVMGKQTNRIPFSSSFPLDSIASSIRQYMTFAVLLTGNPVNALGKGIQGGNGVSIVINSKFIRCVPPFSLLVWINNGGSQSQPPGSSACTHAGISGIIRCK